MRQFMMTVMALAVSGAMVVTAQAENNPSRIARTAESSSTCTELKPQCLTLCAADVLRTQHSFAYRASQTASSQLYCQRICDSRWEQCMKSGWWAGTRVSRAAERR
jgi:hypothetical protein